MKRNSKVKIEFVKLHHDLFPLLLQQKGKFKCYDYIIQKFLKMNRNLKVKMEFVKLQLDLFPLLLKQKSSTFE